MRLPLLNREIAEIADSAAGAGPGARRAACSESNGRGETVEKQVVPLVDCGETRVSGGKTRNGEGSIGVALCEGEVLTVRIAHADVALSEREGIVRTAAVE